MIPYRKHVLVPGTTREQLQGLVRASIDQLHEQARGLGIEVREETQAGVFTLHSSQFEARLECRDGELALEGRLGLFASAFRGKVDQGIERWLKNALPNHTIS